MRHSQGEKLLVIFLGTDLASVTNGLVELFVKSEVPDENMTAYKLAY